MKRLLAAVLLIWPLIAPVHADEADYGPDWPVCRNLNENPSVQVEACTRIMGEGKLTQQHLAWAHNNRGTGWQDLGRFELAEQDFIKSGEIWPTNWQAFWNLGRLYRDTGRSDEALAVANRAIEANGLHTVQLYTLRGELLSYNRPFEAALDDLNKALALDPHLYDALRSRGSVLTKLGRYEEALQDLNKAVAVAPNFSDGYFWRANAELRMGATKAALEDCRYALRLSPQHTPCMVVALHAAFMLGDFREAAERAKQLPRNFFPSAALYQGVALLGSEQVEDAAAALRAYTVAEPSDPYGWLWLYLVDRRLGKAAPADLKELSTRRDAWPTPLFRYIAGTATADEVLVAADVPDANIRKQRIAEANFYLGELASLAGDAVKASAYKQASVSIGYSAIDPLDHIPVYDDNNALELGMAMARPGGEL